ncbi:MAG TPA: hypothetical protein VNL91_00390 [Thermoanaerobaculia bacterium]|nr:hypothetical protein [Thermoanaerobaculia bacterium]
MRPRIVFAVFSLALLSALPLFGARAIPLNCEVVHRVPGIGNDGNPFYDHNGNVRCTFAVNRGVFDLVTYNTGRTFTFDIGPAEVTSLAGLPGVPFNAEVDLFGINYFGKFEEMAPGSTAQLQVDLEFHWKNLTYELDYSALAVTRTGSNTWLITSDDRYDGAAGFRPSAQAELNVIRRKSQTTYGTVNAPIEIAVTIRP